MQQMAMFSIQFFSGPNARYRTAEGNKNLWGTKVKTVCRMKSKSPSITHLHSTLTPDKEQVAAVIVTGILANKPAQ